MLCFVFLRNQLRPTLSQPISTGSSYQLDVWPAVSHLGLILCAPSGPFRPGLDLLPSLKAVPWQISSNTCFRTTQYCYQANAGAKYVICAYASACVRLTVTREGAGLNWLAGRRRRFMQEGPGFEDEQASCSASADLTWTTIKVSAWYLGTINAATGP